MERVWKNATSQISPDTNEAMRNFLKNPVGLLPVGVRPKRALSLDQDACDTCVDRVLEIKVLIKNNATTQGFEKLLANECIKWFSNEDSCYALVSESSDTIFSIIKRLSPEQVCDLVLQCGNLCSECRSELAVTEEALEQDLSQQEIVTVFLDFCTKLGSYSDACKTAITSRMDVVIDDLVSFLQNDPCTYLGACSASSHHVAMVRDEKECTLCMFVWEYVLHTLSDNVTEQAIKNELESLCKILGDEFKSICKNLIESNFDFLIKSILTNETPHRFCSQIGACNNSDIFALALPKQGPSALLCSALASIFQSLVSTELVVKSIVQVVYMSCNILPDETSIENCQSFVMLYVAGILQLINAALPISYICIAFLGNNNSTGISNIYDNSLALSPAVGGFVECSLCELVLDIVRMDIDSPKSVKDIQDDVNMTCQYLPEGSLRNDCETAIILVPVVLDLLTKDMQPDRICQFVAACPNSTTDDTNTELTQISLQEVQSFDFNCFSCKVGIDLTFSLLSSNYTLQEVINLLDNFCSLINSNSGCGDYLFELLPPVIKYLEGLFSPEDVCISLGRCQNDGVGGYTVDKDAPREQFEDAGCLLCSALATILDDYTEAYDEEAIIKIAGELCNQFGVFSDECKSIVANELPSIIEKLRQGETPQQLCSEVDLCQAMSARVSASLLGVVSSGESENECETCLDAIDSIESMLEAEGEEYTEDYLMEQCDAAYPKYVCKQAISQLMKMIQSGENPSSICKYLKLCNINTQVQDYIDCDTCESYGKMVQDELTSDMSSSDFKQVLFNICDQEDIKNCKLYVRMYYLVLYKLLVSDGQSYTDICKEFSFCSGTRVSQRKLNSLSASTKGCAECKFVISIAKQIISNTDEDQIEKNLDYVCNLLGSDKYENCIKLLDSFISNLYEILSGDMSVSELCEEIGACSSSEGVTLQRTYMQLWEQLQQSPSTDCVLCTWISNSIHPELVAMYPQESLKQKLGSKCAQLPQRSQATCGEFLENNYFISTLKHNPYAPTCQAINICPTKARTNSGFSLFI